MNPKEQLLNYIREIEVYDVRDQRTVLDINLSLNGKKFSFSDYYRQRIETEKLIDAKGPITILLYSMPVALSDNVTHRWTLMSPKSIESPELKRVQDYGMVELWNEDQRYLMYWNNFKELIQKDEIKYTKT